MLIHRLRVGAVAVAIATLGSGPSTSLGAGSVASRPRPLNAVIITLDTTRADRLSPYGYMDVSMPSLERLAREATVFNQAISASPLTLPAHTSVLTGLLPPHHGVRDNADRPLADAHTTLAEVFRAHGFRTAAFVGAAVLDRSRGLAQGFDLYSGVTPNRLRPGEVPERPANQVVDEATRWLASAEGSPFLLWTHLYDPHYPYEPPEPIRSDAPTPYVGELAFADAQIGRLLAALDERGLRDNTLVVVVGDHGESLGDHGETDHGIFLYDTVVRVPLMIRMPGVPSRRVSEVVRITDVMPTVLDLAGIAVPRVDGVSLATLMSGRRHGLDLEAYSESLYPQRFGWGALYALRDSRYKFIDAPKPELYDLERDPFEERNIIHERPTVAAAMKQRLAAIASTTSADAEGDSSGASPETRARLASLGYVSGPKLRPATGGSWPDPKDCLPRLGRPVPGSCEQSSRRVTPSPRPGDR